MKITPKLNLFKNLNLFKKYKQTVQDDLNFVELNKETIPEMGLVSRDEFIKGINEANDIVRRANAGEFNGKQGIPGRGSDVWKLIWTGAENTIGKVICTIPENYQAIMVIGGFNGKAEYLQPTVYPKDLIDIHVKYPNGDRYFVHNGGFNLCLTKNNELKIAYKFADNCNAVAVFYREDYKNPDTIEDLYDKIEKLSQKVEELSNK